MKLCETPAHASSLSASCLCSFSSCSILTSDALRRLRTTQDLPEGVLLRVSSHSLEGGARAQPPGEEEQGAPKEVSSRGGLSSLRSAHVSLARLLSSTQGVAMLCTPNMLEPPLFYAECSVQLGIHQLPVYLCFRDLHMREVMSKSVQMRGDWPGCNMLHVSW